jgi:molybdopterin synthase sulfur carrier subunit
LSSGIAFIINIQGENQEMTTVRIPSPLRRYTNGQSKAQTNGANITEVIDNLESQYPGVKTRLCDDSGQIKRYVNVFLNDKEIRTLQGANTPVADTDEVSIVPAMAGGQ